jgi:hypothetical protein
MAKQAEERKVYFHAHGDSLGIGHWSQEGHQAAGELIASWLADSALKDGIDKRREDRPLGKDQKHTNQE